MSNVPYQDGRHARYTPLAKVDDEAIRRVGMKRFEDDGGDVAWMPSEVPPAAER